MFEKCFKLIQSNNTMKAVVSIGNPLKADDNIANLILEDLKLENILKIKGEMNPENYIGKMRDCEIIIFLDALEFGGEVGDVKVFELEEVQETITTTHSISVDMLKKFLPSSKIKIIGIQPKNIDFGIDMSEELKNKISEISKKVEEIVSSL